MSNSHFHLASLQGIFCFSLLYSGTFFLLCVGVCGGERGKLGGEQCALWLLGLAIAICDRATTLRSSAEHASLSNKRIDR